MVNFYPFSYKLLPEDSIHEGIIVPIPTYCTKGKDNPICKNFYLENKDLDGLKQCPYGFCVEQLNIGNKRVFFSGLNIEKRSNRKAVQKYTRKNEYIPLFPLAEYEKIKRAFLSLISEHQAEFNTATAYEHDEAELKIGKERIDNTIHELRKLNNQIKASVTKLNNEIYRLRTKTDLIESLNLDILALSNLQSIRLDTYDLEANPELNLDLGKKDIAIYRKVEKIYKCINSEARKKNLQIRLTGSSYCTFYASEIIEIGIFIILDNAIKYSCSNAEIVIDFFETDSTLILTFNNWGLRPKDDEIKLLTNRGYRSRTLVDQTIQGRGIGLYLLNQICAANKIGLNIKIGKENYYQDSLRYSPFIVELTFGNITKVDSESDELH